MRTSSLNNVKQFARIEEIPESEEESGGGEVKMRRPKTPPSTPNNEPQGDNPKEAGTETDNENNLSYCTV